MDTYIHGYRPPDDKWNAMKGVWDSCRSAKIAVPEEVKRFFAENDPEQPGGEVNIDAAVKDYQTDYAKGFEVDVTKLPKDVTVIRFYNTR